MLFQSFTLVGAGVTQAVTVRFSPTTPATATSSVNFTADGDTISRIVTGIPATTTEIAGDRPLPDGAVIGVNDWGKRAWGGPKPPVGRHRYFFKVYALDMHLDAPNTTRPELYAAMKGHILAQGELIGTYEQPAEHRSAAKQGAERTTHGRR